MKSNQFIFKFEHLRRHRVSQRTALGPLVSKLGIHKVEKASNIKSEALWGRDAHICQISKSLALSIHAGMKMNCSSVTLIFQESTNPDFYVTSLNF